MTLPGKLVIFVGVFDFLSSIVLNLFFLWVNIVCVLFIDYLTPEFLKNSDSSLFEYILCNGYGENFLDALKLIAKFFLSDSCFGFTWTPGGYWIDDSIELNLVNSAEGMYCIIGVFASLLSRDRLQFEQVPIVLLRYLLMPLFRVVFL